jgi:hypothetical protein
LSQTPIFLFSLPRSGSTLVQRILASHDGISTVSEPWILLPYLYSLREKGIYAEYMHRVMSWAIQDFCRELPNGADDYLEEIRALALRLYKKASKKESKYFLDKTPRYHLIAEDIIRLFPDAKCIFLWRNPLSVAASLIDHWPKKKWNLFYYKVDLYRGLSNLVGARRKNQDRTFAVKYEDLILNPETEWAKVFSYLELPFNPEILSEFTQVNLKGRMGDPTGTQKYESISREPLDRWKATFSNPLRKAWGRRYLRWIGADRLKTAGYDGDALLAELNDIPTGFRDFGSDLARMAFEIPFSTLEPMIMKNKLELLPEWHRIFWHS